MKTITVEEIVESVVIERSSSLAYAQAYALCAIAIAIDNLAKAVSKEEGR